MFHSRVIHKGIRALICRILPACIVFLTPLYDLHRGVEDDFRLRQDVCTSCYYCNQAGCELDHRGGCWQRAALLAGCGGLVQSQWAASTLSGNQQHPETCLRLLPGSVNGHACVVRIFCLGKVIKEEERSLALLCEWAHQPIQKDSSNTAFLPDANHNQRGISGG